MKGDIENYGDLFDGSDADANFQGMLLLAKELRRIHFRENMNILMPAICVELEKAGVDFSKAKDIWGDIPETSWS